MNTLMQTKEIYGNYHVHGPDGKWMFATNARKYNWYLNKNLAEIIGDRTIQLKFLPKGNGNIDEPFFWQNHKNQCVCCGSPDDLTKHHVIPMCYRKHFPMELKKHNMHDVLVLCWDCHERYEREADKLKESIRKEFGISTGNKDRSKIKMKILAINLLNDGKKYTLPAHKVEEFTSLIQNYLNKEKVEKEDLLNLAQMPDAENPEADSEGELVVRKQEDLFVFIKRWRSHFLATLNPQYLPDFWDINFKKKLSNPR